MDGDSLLQVMMLLQNQTPPGAELVARGPAVQVSRTLTVT